MTKSQNYVSSENTAESVDPT